MAIVIETFITCDVCSIVYTAQDGHNIPGTKQRKDYNMHNWVYSGNKDLCPNCRPKRQDGNFIKKAKRPNYKRNPKK